MDPDLARRIAEIEDEHWWFEGRRRVIDGMLGGMGLSESSKILAAGCGSGGNLSFLARHGELLAFEKDDASRRLALDRGICEVRPGSLPDDVPFEPDSFDVVVLLDVLEHVEDDEAALRSLGECLRPHGSVVVTVPAYPSLWSSHDVINHHFRRYSRASLHKALAGAGFGPVHTTHFNTLLFPAIAALRIGGKVLRLDAGAGLSIPPSLINRMLAAVFGSERRLATRRSLPFGLSLLTVARLSPAR